MTIGEKITNWFLENGRDLPWRETKDPYRIWVAEIILQQTRIAQGISYFYRFVEKFPDIEALANAEIDDVLKYWEGLGYYSRARNLHAAAKDLLVNYGGKFPAHYSEIIKLKGVGAYTSRAIGSFAFGNQTGVIDGNVLRVMSRVLQDFSPIDDVKTRNKFQEIIDLWVEKTDSAPFNHGIMDIGATICTPTKPACLLCPLENDCIARKEGSAHLLPVKAKKLQRDTRYFRFYLVLNDDEKIAVLRRPEAGLWGGLYEIPNEEVDFELWKTEKCAFEGEYKGKFKHVFTHFDMELQFFQVKEPVFFDYLNNKALRLANSMNNISTNNEPDIKKENNELTKSYNGITEQYNKVTEGYNGITEGYNNTTEQYNGITEQYNEITKDYNGITKQNIDTTNLNNDTTEQDFLTSKQKEGAIFFISKEKIKDYAFSKAVLKIFEYMKKDSF